MEAKVKINSPVRASSESQRNEITSKKLRWSLTTTLSVTDDRACNVVVILFSAPHKCTNGGRNIQIKNAN